MLYKIACVRTRMLATINTLCYLLSHQVKMNMFPMVVFAVLSYIPIIILGS